MGMGRSFFGKAGKGAMGYPGFSSLCTEYV